MSGGSFNYLHGADWCDLVWRRDDVDMMHGYLEQLNEEGSPCSGAIAETKEILDALDSLEKLVGTKRLERVWHAAEWHRSSDYGIQQFRDVVAEHYPNDIARDAHLRAVVLNLSHHGDLTPTGKHLLLDMLGGEE